MKKLFFETNQAVANYSGAMESGDHSKNGASSKSRMSRWNILILVCFALLATFSECSKDDKDDNLRQADFYGKWKNKNNAIRDISANSIIINVNNQWNAVIRLKSVTPVTNSSGLTKSDYPKGFTFTGEITSLTGSGIGVSWKVGDTYSETFFMHNNKKSIMEMESSDDSRIYTKQP
jgi:hypothetical protein